MAPLFIGSEVLKIADVPIPLVDPIEADCRPIPIRSRVRAGVRTGVPAKIEIVGVSVVALFDSHANKSVTALRRLASIRTGVGVAAVSIVAFLFCGAAK